MIHDRTTSRDRGETAMWVAISLPIVLILCLVLLIVLWRATSLLVALIVFVGLCAVAIAVAKKLQQRSRGF